MCARRSATISPSRCAPIRPHLAAVDLLHHQQGAGALDVPFNHSAPDYLGSADFARVVAEDYRRKGELIKVLPLRR